MAEKDKPRKTTSSRRQSRRRRRSSPSLGRFWAEWRVEIIIVLVIMLAIFLLVEQMQIRQTLLGWAMQGLNLAESGIRRLARGVLAFARGTTLSDLVGYTLLLVTAVVIVWRTRWRLMHTPRFTTQKCPDCGSELHRVHRRRRDRLLNLFVPVRRYQCKDQDCRWRGLRVRTSRHT